MSLNSLHNPAPGTSQSDIYTDLNALHRLKNSARKDSQAAIPEVAKQFEAVMISMMIKNLRKTGMEDPIFKSQAMDSYRDMYDQQLGMELSKGEGIGFAKAIAEQIKYQSANQQTNQQANHSATPLADRALTMPQRRHFPDYYAPVVSSAESSPAESLSADSLVADSLATNSFQTKEIQQTHSDGFNSPQEFVQKLWPLAENAAQKLGVSAEMILSQAALETGWGKHVVSDRNNSSYNLFNIKAGQSWSGERVEKVSMEFIADHKQQLKSIQQKSDFRSYASYAQSFDDYVDLVKNNSRYSTFINNSPEEMNKPEQSLHDKLYIRGLHKAGYATDPDYSDKVLRVLNSEAIQSQRLNQIKLASK